MFVAGVDLALGDGTRPQACLLLDVEESGRHNCKCDQVKALYFAYDMNASDFSEKDNQEFRYIIQFVIVRSPLGAFHK